MLNLTVALNQTNVTLNMAMMVIKDSNCQLFQMRLMMLMAVVVVDKVVHANHVLYHLNVNFDFVAMTYFYFQSHSNLFDFLATAPKY